MCFYKLRLEVELSQLSSGCNSHLWLYITVVKRMLFLFCPSHSLIICFSAACKELWVDFLCENWWIVNLNSTQLFSPPSHFCYSSSPLFTLFASFFISTSSNLMWPLRVFFMSKHLTRNWTQLYSSGSWDSPWGPDACEWPAWRANNDKMNVMPKCLFLHTYKDLGFYFYLSCSRQCCLSNCSTIL